MPGLCLCVFFFGRVETSLGSKLSISDSARQFWKINSSDGDALTRSFCSSRFCSVFGIYLWSPALFLIVINEMRHDKTIKVTVRPAKTQISLDIFAVRMKKAWVRSYPLIAQRRL